MEVSVHRHREKQQGFTTLHSAVSHSVNEVRQLVFKRKHVRWFYQTQADACGSRVIEWFWRLAYRCWSPLPTYRIVCDTGSDDLLGRICHPLCSVSVTPSKARLIGFCDKRNIPIRCHRENLQGSTSLHFVGSHNGNSFWKCASSRRSECWVTWTFWGTCLRQPVRANLFPWSHNLEIFENRWSILARSVLYVQRYCGREKHQVPLTLSDGVLSGSLPQFVPNWVFRKVLGPHTCLILPGVRSEGMHVKRFSRPRSSKGLHKREKNRIRNHLNCFDYGLSRIIRSNHLRT